MKKYIAGLMVLGFFVSFGVVKADESYAQCKTEYYQLRIDTPNLAAQATAQLKTQYPIDLQTEELSYGPNETQAELNAFGHTDPVTIKYQQNLLGVQEDVPLIENTKLRTCDSLPDSPISPSSETYLPVWIQSPNYPGVGAATIDPTPWFNSDGTTTPTVTFLYQLMSPASFSTVGGPNGPTVTETPAAPLTGLPANQNSVVVVSPTNSSNSISTNSSSCSTVDPNTQIYKNTIANLTAQVASLQAQLNSAGIKVAGLAIPGCGNRTTGFSITTGNSCVGNTPTVTSIAGCGVRTTGFSTTTGMSCVGNVSQ